MACELNKELDPQLKAYLNKYIDRHIIEGSQQLYDAVNNKFKTVVSL
jgi:hypothetical protein